MDGNAVIASAVTQQVTYPTGKVSTSVLFLGGNGLHRFIDSLAEEIIRFAKYHGADLIEIPIGRPGWARPLAKHGMKRTGLIQMEAIL